MRMVLPQSVYGKHQLLINGGNEAVHNSSVFLSVGAMMVLWRRSGLAFWFGVDAMFKLI
jgi:hypothetical protein